MKKFTFLVAALCATMMASAAVIQIDDFNSVALAATQANQTVTVQGVTLSFNGTIVDATYEGKTYRTLRVYAGKTLTVSCAEKITKIEVIGMAKKDANVTASAGTVVGGSFSADTYAYENGFDEPLFVINDVNATSTVITPVKQIRLYGIRVTTGEGGGSEGGGSEGGGSEGGEEGGGSEGGGEEEGGEGGETEETVVENKTIAEFIANKGGKCYLTGAVGEIKNTTFGNFYLTDASGTIFVYGCLTADGQSKQFETLGVAQGDTLTVLASVYEVYQSQDQAKDVIYVSHKKATAIRTVEIDNTVYARDGRIYAEEGARIYSLTGLDVTRMNGNLEGIYIVKNGNKVAKVAVAK